MRPSSLTGDAALGYASRAADGSRIWLAIAAVFAVGGGRFLRRAALRGLVSLAAAEVVANGVAKPLVRRRRPSRRRAAHLAQPKAPSTSSFPSAHAAAAVAFATGAGLEAPVAGAGLGVLAGVVSWSRVRTGMHHRTDVIAGAAIGAGVAAATVRFWPRAPRNAATATAVAGRGDQSALAAARVDGDGTGVGVVVNASSGPALSLRDAATQLRDALPGADIVEVDHPDTLPETVERLVGTVRVLGVCGGDGTVNFAASVAHRAGIPLAVFPGGTLNHFARALGFEQLDDTVAAIRDGHVADVDMGCAGDHAFLNVASVGIYPELVAARERLEGRIGKWPAVVVGLVRVLRRSEPVTVTVDGVRRCVWMIFVGNCRYYPQGFAPGWRERLDDGVFDIRIVDAAPRWSRLRVVGAVLTGTLGRSRVYEARPAMTLELRIESDDPKLAVDGEVLDAVTKFAISKLPSPLTVFAPAPNENRSLPRGGRSLQSSRIFRQPASTKE